MIFISRLLKKAEKGFWRPREAYLGTPLNEKAMIYGSE